MVTLPLHMTGLTPMEDVKDECLFSIYHYGCEKIVLCLAFTLRKTFTNYKKLQNGSAPAGTVKGNCSVL